jgi:hypothetical protein
MATLMLEKKQINSKDVMKFAYKFGENEAHVLELDSDPLLGRVVIKLNKEEVARKTQFFSWPLADTFSVVVPHDDTRQNLSVRIEKERNLWKGEKCRIFVNNRLAQVFS